LLAIILNAASTVNNPVITGDHLNSWFSVD